MNKEYKELRKNTLIIAIANLGSKIISFILAPLYSYYMSVSQYGTMDIITSTVTLVAPFVILDVYEATFRYANDPNYDNRKVLSTSVAFCIPGLLLCGCLYIISSCGSIFPSYFGAVCICIMATVVNYVLKQYLRGIGKMAYFASSGIIGAISLLICNYIFLVYLRMKLDGWLYSFLISRIIETIYLLAVTKFINVFSFKAISKEYMQEFIRFCIPLMPTAIMWWIMSLSDRYMLAYFMGTAATGLYAVANKLPNLLSVFENIFYQAWQTTAISTSNHTDKEVIYSSVFNNYLIVMMIGMLGVLVIGKPMVVILFEKTYSQAYLYVPVLIAAVVLHAINGNLGSLYTVFKNTKGALYSTIIGAMTNVILNCIFIPYFGVMGASLTTLLGYLFTLIYRWFDTKKFVKIVLDKKKLSIMGLLVLISFCFYYVNGVVSYSIRIIILLYALIKNAKLLMSVLKR